MTTQPDRPRLWEIDAVRGIAVVLMAFFHLMWDLQFFGISNINVFSPPWQGFARAIGSAFILLMGVSLTLDAERNNTNTRALFIRHLKRGLTILGFGLVISLATYVILGSQFVRFGILHHAGVAIILAFFFVRAPSSVNWVVGLLVITLGFFVPQVVTTTTTMPWLLPLGIVPEGMTMVDYYPLIPWFGVALMGICAGQWLYPKGQRQYRLPNLGSLLPARLLSWVGRHSLAVYLLHQPVLIAVVFVIVHLVGVIR